MSFVGYRRLEYAVVLLVKWRLSTNFDKRTAYPKTWKNLKNYVEFAYWAACKSVDFFFQEKFSSPQKWKISSSLLQREALLLKNAPNFILQMNY